MPFPSDPAGQTPANTFSPTSTPDANTLNNATYTYNATDNQWSTRDPAPPTPVPPPAGTAIETPTFSAPVDGADSNVDQVLTASAYTVAQGQPGPHASSSWQVIRGETPLRSTNAITAVTDQDADWTLTAIGANITTQLCYVVQDPANADRWVGFGANTSNNTEIYISSDNCATWTLQQTLSLGQRPVAPWWNLDNKDTEAPSANNNFQKAIQVWGGNAPGVVVWVRTSSSSSVIWGTFDRIFDGSGVNTWTSGAGGAGPRYQGFCGIWIDEDNGNVQIPLRFAGSGNSGDWSNQQLVDARTTSSATGWTPPGLDGNFVADSPYLFARRPGGVTIAFMSESGNQNVARRTDGFSGPYEGGNWAYIPGLENENDFQDTFGAGSFPTNLFWDEQNSLWVVTLNSGIFTSDNDGDTWVARVNPMVIGTPWSIVPTATGWCIGDLFQDEMMFTDDWITYSPLFTPDNTDNFRVPNFLEGNGTAGSGETRFGGCYPSPNGVLAGRFLATIPADQLQLTIAGTQTDGFTVGRRVQQFNNPNEATGTIIDVNDTNMTLFPVQGTWAVGGQVMTTFEDFNQIVDAVDDTTNLTTFTLTADQLLPGVEYSCRVQYRSDSNVTSSVSDWYSFTTAV